jgi:uncharacterized membrane protein
MNNPIFLGIFAVVVYAALCIFLWDVVLPITKKKLKVEDRSTAKYFLLALSLILFGLSVHSGYSVISNVFDFTNPL